MEFRSLESIPRRQQLPLAALAALVVLLLGVSIGGVAFASPSDQPAPAPAAAAAPPIDMAATAMVIPVWKATVLPGGSAEGIPITPGGYVGPMEPMHLEFQTLCSSAAVKRVGTRVTFMTVGHCFDEEIGKSALEVDRSLLMAKANRSKAADPVTALPPATPTAKEDLPEIKPELTVYLYQPKGVQGAYITSPMEATVLHTRKMENGNDSAILQLDLPDPSVNVPVFPLADTAPALETPVRAIGYPGSHIEGLQDAMFPNHHHRKKGVLDILQEQVLAPTTTTGTVSGKQRIRSTPVTEVNSDVDSGMSGGPALNSDNEVIGSVVGRFNGSAGNFSIISHNTDLIRSDLQSQGVNLGEAGASATVSEAERHMINQAVQDALGTVSQNSGLSTADAMAIVVAAICIAIAAFLLGLVIGLHIGRRMPQSATPIAVRQEPVQDTPGEDRLPLSDESARQDLSVETVQPPAPANQRRWPWPRNRT